VVINGIAEISVLRRLVNKSSQQVLRSIFICKEIRLESSDIVRLALDWWLHKELALIYIQDGRFLVERAHDNLRNARETQRMMTVDKGRFKSMIGIVDWVKTLSMIFKMQPLRIWFDR
jgi:hypothetical protein